MNPTSSKKQRKVFIGQYLVREGVTHKAKQERDNTAETEQYRTELKATEEFIKEGARSGDLPLMIDLEKALQTSDLLRYSITERDQEHSREALKQLESGIAQYKILMETPDIYRTTDKTYHGSGSRDMRRDVPKDGMRKALTSQTTRLKNRMALTSLEEEKSVLSARLSLLKSIEKEYAREQERVVHGRPDDDIS